MSDTWGELTQKLDVLFSDILIIKEQREESLAFLAISGSTLKVTGSLCFSIAWRASALLLRS